MPFANGDELRPKVGFVSVELKVPAVAVAKPVDCGDGPREPPDPFTPKLILAKFCDRSIPCREDWFNDQGEVDVAVLMPPAPMGIPPTPTGR